MRRGGLRAVALAFVLAALSLGSASGAAVGAVLVVTPPSVAFSALPVGTAETQTLTIRNTGVAALNLTTPVLQSGASSGLSLRAPASVTVAPGGSTTVTVTFRPVAPGPVSGTVLISSTNGGSALVALTGVGVAPDIVDTTAPTLNGVPDSRTVDATSPAGAIVSWTAPTATDDVSGSVPVTCWPASGASCRSRTSHVECSATDAADNTATASST
jgi:hypothetical protein